jgi:integrase
MSTGDRLEALWTLVATTGMRRSELLGLGWRDVDLDTRQLHVGQALVSYGTAVLQLKELLAIVTPSSPR